MSVALYNTAVKITALGGLGALAAYAVNTCVLRSETPASAVTAAVYTTHAANQTQEMTSTSYAHAHAQAQAQAQTQREADVQLGFDLRMPVILGSESKFRRQILKELHVPHR